MKIAIYGAGAVGGNIGARLFSAGHEVSLIARGPHLAAIQEQGLALVEKHPDVACKRNFRIPATDNPADLPAQDLVVISCKSYDIPRAAVAIQPLLNEATMVLPVANGIPWWFTTGIGGNVEGYHIAALDPENLIPRHITAERVLGGLVYMGSGVEGPGVVTCYDKRPRIVIGEPAGGTSLRAESLKQIFYDSGFSATASTNIRGDVWQKLCWNIAFNPLSVLTRLTSYELATQEPHISTIRKVMEDMARMADAMKLGITVDVAAQMLAAIRTPGHKTSMLQDHERGKRLEIEAIIGSVVEIAEQTGTPIPAILDLFHEVRKFA